MNRQIEIEIHILNWDKFNPRRDIKNPSWFRMQHDIFENPEFYHFTHSELCVFVYVLCLASKKNVPKVVLYMMHAERIGRFDTETVLNALEKLNEINIIRYKHVTHPIRTRGGTIRTRTLRDETRRDETVYIGPCEAQPPSEFDFEKLYENYPLRKGSHRKADAMRVCVRNFKTPEQYEQLSKAIKNYKDHCEKENKIGTEFVNQFKTFVNSIWQEWVNPVQLPNSSVFDFLPHHQGGDDQNG